MYVYKVLSFSLFREFLEQPCAQMYLTLTWYPNVAQNFLPEHFRADNVFFDTTVTYQSWLQGSTTFGTRAGEC